MYIPFVIEEKNKAKGWENERAAILADMDYGHFMKIATGLLKPNYEDAKKLSGIYEIPVSFFLIDETTATHMNFAEGASSNSNHGYIHSFANNSDSGLKELVKELITLIKPDIIWSKMEEKKEN